MRGSWIVADRENGTYTAGPGLTPQGAELAGEMVLAHRRQKRRSRVHDILVIGGAILGWFALQAFVLPKLGFST
jgi:hypothetical protein